MTSPPWSRHPGSLALLALLTLAASLNAEPRTYSLVNGKWFDGSTFVPGTRYVVDGVFCGEAPSTVDRTLDLEGGYVIPPFGEAHNHNIEGAWGLDRQIRKYLEDGIFYVKILNSVEERVDTIRERLDHPTSVDVVFAHGAITGPNGHPIRLYEEILWRKAYRSVDSRDWFRGRAYHVIDSLAELDRQWEQIRQEPPHFIKVILHSSEQHEVRSGNPEYYGRSGLDPSLLPWIVARARRAGLRVSVHVETAADFAHAVAAGVDEISHLPGYSPSSVLPPETYLIVDRDAEAAARQGITVVTTTLISRLRAEERGEGWIERARSIQRQNLRTLQRHGVAVAVGSDDYESTSRDEARNLFELGAFDNLALLKAWVEATPATIFPSRRLGRLEPGYEASFLVLARDPLLDFSATEEIVLRFKDGKVLELPPESGAPGGGE